MWGTFSSTTLEINRIENEKVEPVVYVTYHLEKGMKFRETSTEVPNSSIECYLHLIPNKLFLAFINGMDLYEETL